MVLGLVWIPGDVNLGCKIWDATNVPMQLDMLCVCCWKQQVCTSIGTLFPPDASQPAELHQLQKRICTIFRISVSKRKRKRMRERMRNQILAQAKFHLIIKNSYKNVDLTDNYPDCSNSQLYKIWV